ncbi:beta strand repeat-containing protein, partial [Bradyrhizobium sacchari]
HITNSGSVVAAPGHAAIFIQENATGSATIDNSGTIGPAIPSSVTSATYAIVETGGAITINNTGHINGNISVVSATFNNNAGGIWTVAGSSVFGNVSSIVNAGEIDLLGGASISVTGPGITNSNEIESWGTASITGTITNNHFIEVHTGTLTLFGSLSGSGSVKIDAGATLEVKNAVAQTVTFAGAGAELEIDTATFGGSIAGFAAGDKIDLSAFTWDSGTTAVYNSATGNLVVSDTHGHSFTLKLIGNYSDAHFITSSDGAGGTLVGIAPVDEWTNPFGGDWNTASDWSLGVPAANYDVKLFAAGEPYTVDSTTNVTIHDLTVDSSVTLLTEPGTVFTVNGDVVLDGLIEAGPFSDNDVSTIDIKGNVTGTGAIEISNKAVVEIEGSVSGIVVYYDNGLGTLILDHAKDFHGLISGSPAGAPLSSNNLIDLKDLAWTSTMSAQADYNADTNITTVGFYNGTATVTLSFLGRDVNWHLQSDGHGGTTVYDPLAGAPMTIESGAVLNLSEASAQDVTFANNAGTTGTLAIEHAADFTGVINGFAGDGTVAGSDLLDLKDIDFSHLTGVSYTENADHLGGVLTLGDGTDTATIKFAGVYNMSSFHFASDGHGGTLVIDPPAGPTLVGTSGQDQFAFANSTLPVQSTIVDFELGQDKIDLREFASIKSFSDIAITQQAGDALVTIDDHQSILLKNLVASSLHASDFIVANHA